MKKTSIVAIVLIAVAIAAIISSYGDASTYETFSVAADNPKSEFHVVGTLDTTQAKYYNPQQDPNYFSFYMKDEKGNVSKVVYRAPEPQDFERSEKIVIIGKMAEGHFEASKILLKCPSKYTENEVKS
jgi:cytochrome c-type biogenesis protein CcmE